MRFTLAGIIPYSRFVGFPWMVTRVRAEQRSAQSDRRALMYRRELAQRAGMLYRLGYPPSRAIARLVANVEWDFELGTGGRPANLSNEDIEEIVKSTYLRRPSR